MMFGNPRAASLSLATLATLLLALPAAHGETEQDSNFRMLDVFELEWVSDPQIAPDASQVVYRRMGFDIMKARRHGALWLISASLLSIITAALTYQFFERPLIRYFRKWRSQPSSASAKAANAPAE